MCLSRSYILSKRINISSNCRAMRCISAAYVVMRCLFLCPCVRVPVTFVSCVKTNEDIFEMFSPSGSQAILVFPCQTGCRYSDGNPPNGGVEYTHTHTHTHTRFLLTTICQNAMQWGRQKRDFGGISGFAAYRSTLLSTVRVAQCEK